MIHNTAGCAHDQRGTGSECLTLRPIADPTHEDGDGQARLDTLNFGGNLFDSTQKRIVCVSPSGRARITEDGTCS